MMTKRLSALALLSTLYVTPTIADITITTPTVTPLVTSVDGNVTITNTGRVTTAAADAITMDSESQVVTILPGNTTGACGAFTGCAIVTTGASGSGIVILEKSNAVLIGANSVISAIDHGIDLQEGPATISNEGKIYGGTGGGAFSAIEISNTGASGSVLSNVLGAHIESKGTQSSVFVLSEGLMLSNAGTIRKETSAAAVQFMEDFLTINNTGSITASNAVYGMLLSPTGVGNGYTGNITNSGTISNVGTVAGVYYGYFLGDAFTGTFDNSGTISVNSTAPGGGFAIRMIPGGNTIGTFNNLASGRIIGSDQDFGLSILNSTAGTVNNAGLIQTNAFQAVHLGIGGTCVLDAFTNSGTITMLTDPGPLETIIANGTTITNGFTNTGIIRNVAGGEAIDFGSNPGNTIHLKQNGGTIEGDVLLASNGGTVLTMTSGIITGDVSVSPIAAAPSTLNLSGGEIQGDLNVGINDADIVNLSGTTLGDIFGNTGPAPGNTYNVSGGSFTSLTGGTALLDVMNVTGDFTFDGPGDITDLDRIEIKNNAIATFNGDIKNLQTEFLVTSGIGNINGLLTDAGAATARSAVGGILTVGSTGAVTIDVGDNKGQFILYEKTQAVAGVANNFNMTFTGKYFQNAGSNLGIEIGGPLNYGTMVSADTAVLDPTSTVTPFLTPIAFIPDQSVYPIINTANVMATAPIVNPFASISIRFTGAFANANTEFDLIAQRQSYSYGALTPNAVAVAYILDALAAGTGTTNPDLRFLLIQLDQIQNVQEMTDALEQLIPPMDYGMVEGAHVGMDMSFETVQRRIEDVRGVREMWGSYYDIVREWDGINYGDVDDFGNEVLVGTWIKAYGDWFEQKKHLGFDGYRGNAVGMAFGMDWTAIIDSVLGVCASYTKVNIETQNPQNNVQDITNYQGTFYAFLEPCDSIYVDWLLGIGLSKFENRRNIAIREYGASAFSKFDGIQTGTLVEAGYVFLKNNFYVAPIGRFKYTHLRLDDYTETGAGGIGLSVQNRSFNELLVGGGLRFAFKQEFVQACYVPNAQVLYLYAVENQAQTTTANFLGGGAAFASNGIKPGKDIVLVNVGINAITNDNYVFRGKFEWEWRNHFLGYSGFLELYHRWL